MSEAVRKIYKPQVITAGPFPVQYVGEAVAQLLAQEWEVGFVMFAGMIAPKIISAENPGGVPVYFVMAMKYPSFDGEGFPTPVIKFKEGPNAQNN